MFYFEEKSEGMGMAIGLRAKSVPLLLSWMLYCFIHENTQGPAILDSSGAWNSLLLSCVLRTFSPAEATRVNQPLFHRHVYNGNDFFLDELYFQPT
jgi:hypothetical protein